MKKKGLDALFLLQFLFLFADITKEGIGREASCAHAMGALVWAYKRIKSV